MNIAVEGKNFFYTGWAACFLGLGRQHLHADAIKPGDLAAFTDGWNMCQETKSQSGIWRAALLDTFEREIEIGSIRVFWVDDNNEEIEE